MYTSLYIMTTPIVMPVLRAVVPVLRMSRMQRSLGGGRSAIRITMNSGAALAHRHMLVRGLATLHGPTE